MDPTINSDPFGEDRIGRQNHLYATGLIDRLYSTPKTYAVVIDALIDAFLLGAGGYTPLPEHTDAAAILDCGGLELLLEKVGLSHIDQNPRQTLDVSTFEIAIHAAVGYGAVYDEFELEIPDDALSFHDITGELFGPLMSRYVHIIDPNEYIEGDDNT